MLGPAGNRALVSINRLIVNEAVRVTQLVEKSLYLQWYRKGSKAKCDEGVRHITVRGRKIAAYDASERTERPSLGPRIMLFYTKTTEREIQSQAS